MGRRGQDDDACCTLKAVIDGASNATHMPSLPQPFVCMGASPRPPLSSCVDLSSVPRPVYSL